MSRGTLWGQDHWWWGGTIMHRKRGRNLAPVRAGAEIILVLDLE